MKSGIRFRWLLVATSAVLTVVGAWLFRGWLLESTRQRLVQSYHQQVTALPERDAARLVLRLAENDGQWLEILVRASGDDRPLVSRTAGRELQDLVDQWPSLPAEASSDRAVRLAKLLAEHAASAPPDRRALAHSLAHRLIVWPVDGRRVNMARFIADCQSVLLLPQAEPPVIQVAAVPVLRTANPARSQAPTTELQRSPPESRQSLPELQPRAVEPSPAEPQPFRPPPGMRIYDR